MTTHVLIIGFGYLGNVLAQLLLKHNHIVSAIKRSPVSDNTDIHFIFKNINDLTIDDLPTCQYVVYCPAPDERNTQEYQHTYVDGVTHVLNLFEQKEIPPELFIHISSTSVYGFDDGRWVNEDTPVHPNTETAEILLKAEHQVKASSLNTCIIRFSGIYGPHRMPLVDAVRNKKAHICHDTRYSNRIHIVDCARMIYHVMHLQYNHGLYIGTDCEPTPINTIVSWLSTHLGIKLPEAKHKLSPEEQHHKSNKQLSNERILHTGFRFEFNNFHQGLGHILFRKEHPK